METVDEKLPCGMCQCKFLFIYLFIYLFVFIYICFIQLPLFLCNLHHSTRQDKDNNEKTDISKLLLLCTIYMKV